MSDANNGDFKEAVCVEVQRVFDSCSDKDCIEDLEVTFSDPADAAVIENANFVKAKCAEVINAAFAIDPVPFNKGFYTVDITYTFKIDLEAFVNSMTPPTPLSGTASFTKKVILYGSDGGAKTFNSDDLTDQKSTGCGCCYESLPKASVSVVEPIILDSGLTCKNPCGCNQPCPVSDNGQPEPFQGIKTVLVTIGMFSIVRLSRPVSILIPAYDYCVPEKECAANTDSPCELFDKISFPIEEFFPKSLDDTENGCGCQNQNG